MADSRETMGARGLSASVVNQKFGQWLAYRGEPRVPPIAQTAGVSYVPMENTLDTAFSDAFKSLPELVKGARGTYEAYWEQAKKAADDYRAGKSLSEIQKDMESGNVPLQYRPLVMSALQFRQGQESMQIAAQDLTNKINSGEFAEMSPMELDEASTRFMNESLQGFKDAYGNSGGTDAFYNGYYSEVGKVREFAQQRNDQIVEQRRRQDVEIQTQAAIGEMAQTIGITGDDILAGIASLKDNFNLSPEAELKAYEAAIQSLGSNPDGAKIIDSMRGLRYGDKTQTLEEFFTSAYFDQAQINASNIAFQADAERMTKDLERWNTLAANGSVGAIRNELSAALIRGGNKDTKEVQYLRNYLMSAQATARSNAKAAANKAQKDQQVTAVLSGLSYNLDSFGSDKAIQDAFSEAMGAQATNLLNETDPQKFAQSMSNFITMAGNGLKANDKAMSKALQENEPFLNSIADMTEGDKQYILQNPLSLMERGIGIDPAIDPQGYRNEVARREKMFQISKNFAGDPRVMQAIMGDSAAFGGHEQVMFIADKANNWQELTLGLLRAEENSKKAIRTDIMDAAIDRGGGDTTREDLLMRYMTANAHTGKGLTEDDIVNAERWVDRNFIEISPEPRNLVGTASYDPGVVPNRYINEARQALVRVNSLQPPDKQWDMNMVDDGDVSDVISYYLQDQIGAMLIDHYEQQGLPYSREQFLTQRGINNALDEQLMRVAVRYNDVIGDFVIVFTDQNGNPYYGRDGGKYVNVRNYINTLGEDPVGFERTMQVATGKTLEQIKRTEDLKQYAPSWGQNLQQLETIGGYQAERIRMERR